MTYQEEKESCKEMMSERYNIEQRIVLNLDVMDAQALLIDVLASTTKNRALATIMMAGILSAPSTAKLEACLNQHPNIPPYTSALFIAIHKAKKPQLGI